MCTNRETEVSMEHMLLFTGYPRRRETIQGVYLCAMRSGRRQRTCMTEVGTS